MITISQSKLEELLESAAERGAKKALMERKRGVSIEQREWVTKEVALDILQKSYRTLARLSNEGYIRKNSYQKHGAKYYKKQDLLDYMAGKKVIHKP